MSYEFKTNLSEAERIVKNVMDMAEYRKGSIPYDRDIGVDSTWKDKATGLYTARIMTEMSDMLNLKEERATTKVSQDSKGNIILEVTPNGTD